MTYTTTQREWYNHDRDITCKELGITKNQYNWFRRQGEYLHRYFEANCNGEFENDRAYDLAVSPLYELVDTKCQELGLYVFYQTDPRGATIYLSQEPIADNNYNRIGSCCIY